MPTSSSEDIQHTSQEFAALKAENAALWAKNAELRAKNAELEARGSVARSHADISEVASLPGCSHTGPGQTTDAERLYFSSGDDVRCMITGQAPREPGTLGADDPGIEVIGAHPLKTCMTNSLNEHGQAPLYWSLHPRQGRAAYALQQDKELCRSSSVQVDVRCFGDHDAAIAGAHLCGHKYIGSHPITLRNIGFSQPDKLFAAARNTAFWAKSIDDDAWSKRRVIHVPVFHGGKCILDEFGHANVRTYIMYVVDKHLLGEVAFYRAPVQGKTEGKVAVRYSALHGK